MKSENILLLKIGYRKQRNIVNNQIKPYKQGIWQKIITEIVYQKFGLHWSCPRHLGIGIRYKLEKRN